MFRKDARCGRGLLNLRKMNKPKNEKVRFLLLSKDTYDNGSHIHDLWFDDNWFSSLRKASAFLIDQVEFVDDWLISEMVYAGNPQRICKMPLSNFIRKYGYKKTVSEMEKQFTNEAILKKKFKKLVLSVEKLGREVEEDAKNMGNLSYGCYFDPSDFYVTGSINDILQKISRIKNILNDKYGISI